MELSNREIAILESLPEEQFIHELRTYVLTGVEGGYFGDFSILSRPDRFAGLRNTAKAVLRGIVKSKSIDTTGDIRIRMSKLNDIFGKATSTGVSLGRSALL